MSIQVTQNIGAKGLKVAIFGLGFVGTSIASAWLRAGARVDGFDVSVQRINSLKNPKSIEFEEAVEKAFQNGFDDGRLHVYSVDEASKHDSSVKFVCVPVYLSEKDKSADLTFLRSAAKSVARALKKGDAVVICPSVPPGTTRKVVVPLLETGSGLTAGNDFDVIYSPERILVGRAVQDIEERYPAIISGIDEKSLDRAESLFLRVAKKGVIRMPNLETAEFEKLAEGVYRDVNIALANELAMACDELGVNFWSVRDAANSQPFCHLHVPGLGVGGACIPVYPWFVAGALKKSAATIIEDSRSINDSMVEYAVASLVDNFHLSPKTRIAILGLSFRGGVADSRLSVSYRLVDLLREKGFNQIMVHDPLIKRDSRFGEILTDDLDDVLSHSDVAIIVTDHKMYSEYDWDLSAKNGSELKIIDTKGLLMGKKLRRVRVYGLGYGDGINPRFYERVPKPVD